MSCSSVAPPPVGLGVNWTQLLDSLWICASSWAALVLICASFDLVHRCVSKTAVGKLDSWYRGTTRVGLRERALAITHPASRSGRFLLIATLVLSLAQYVFWVTLTYSSTLPVRSNAATLAVVGLLTFFFASRQLVRLAACEPGLRVWAALSVEHGVDSLATAGLAISPFITGSWFSFAPLRMGTMLIEAAHISPWLETSFGLSTLGRHLFRMAVQLLSFVALFVSAVATMERVGEPSGWEVSVGSWALGSALYFGVVSVSTVGYGDIVAVTTLGRTVVCFSLAGGLILIALLSARLIDIITEARAGGGRINNSGNKTIVLVCGDADTEQLNRVLSELFHAEHEVARKFVHASILFDDAVYSPVARRWFGEHTILAPLVSYLRGSVFQARDLERAGANSSSLQAIFVLQRFSASDDSSNILRVLALRRAAPHVPLLVQLSNSSHKAFVQSTGVAAHNIFCLDALRSGLLAANVETPGTIPLLCNLFSADSHPKTRGESTLRPFAPGLVALDAAATRGADVYQRLLERTIAHAAVAIEDFQSGEETSWVDTYSIGLGQELIEIVCPHYCVGRSVREAAILIFLSSSMLTMPACDLRLEGLLELLAVALAGCGSSSTYGPVLVSVHRRGAHGAILMTDVNDATKLEKTDSLFVMIAPSALETLSHEKLACGYRLIDCDGSINLEGGASNAAPTPAEAQSPPPHSVRAREQVKAIKHRDVAWPPSQVEPELPVPSSLTAHVVVILPSRGLLRFVAPFLNALRNASSRAVVVVCSAPIERDASGEPSWAATLDELTGGAVARGATRRTHVRLVSGAIAPIDNDEAAAWAPGNFSQANEVSFTSVYDRGPVYYIRSIGFTSTDFMRARLAHASAACVFTVGASVVDDAAHPQSVLAPLHFLESDVERGHRENRLAFAEDGRSSMANAPCISEADTSAVLITRLIYDQLARRENLLAGLTTEVARDLSAKLLESDAKSVPAELLMAELPSPVAPRRPPSHRLRSRADDARILRSISLTMQPSGRFAPTLLPWELPTSTHQTRVDVSPNPSALSLTSSDAEDVIMQIAPPTIASSSVRLDARYAAGKLLPLGLLDSLLVATFWNPSLSKLVAAFARGDTCRIVHVGLPAAILHSPACPNPLTCACSVSYGLVWIRLIVVEKTITLGIFRRGAREPYVVTSPPLNFRCVRDDVLFCVVPS